MLRVHDLRKAYGGVQALQGVDVTVESGQVLALLGPNGAGKTTFVSIVAGLRRPDGGSVEIGGIDAVAHPTRAQHLVGIAPQDTGIYPVVSVSRNLRLFAELAGMSRSDAARRAEEVAAAVGLEELLDRKAGTLSGGQKRRLHTAMALVHRPSLLLLDEATTGADVETRKQMLRLIRDLADSGSAVLYSTHYLHEVEELGGSVVIIDQGSVIARGQVDQLIQHHGGSALELAFEGSPPELEALGGSVTREGALRIPTDAPAEMAVEILPMLGDHRDRVRSISIMTPSLETVYLNLTGRTFSEAEAEGGGDAA